MNNCMRCMSFYILYLAFSSNNSVGLGLHFSENQSIHPSDRWLLYERDKTCFRQWSGIKHSLTFNVADHSDCLELHGSVILLNVRLFQRIDFEGPILNFSNHMMCHHPFFSKTKIIMNNFAIITALLSSFSLLSLNCWLHFLWKICKMQNLRDP